MVNPILPYFPPRKYACTRGRGNWTKKPRHVWQIGRGAVAEERGFDEKGL